MVVAALVIISISSSHLPPTQVREAVVEVLESLTGVVQGCAVSSVHQVRFVCLFVVCSFRLDQYCRCSDGCGPPWPLWST